MGSSALLKYFRQRRPNGQGGWIWNLDNTRRVLYRLPDLIETVSHGGTVYITEGEKDADAINALNSDAPSPSFIATCNPGGAGKWRSEYNAVLRNASVIIIADKDEAGRNHALQVAESLKGVAATIEIREAAIGKDAADHLAAGRTLEDFPLVEPNFSGVESRKSQRNSTPNNNRPTIVVRNELPEVVAEAEAALLAASEVGIYTRAGILVRVIQDGARHVPGLVRPPGAPLILPVTEPWLREQIAIVANWVTRNGKQSNGEGKASPALPPRWVAQTLLDRGEWPFPYLEAVMETPAFRPDGTVLDSPGYDSSTGILYLPEGTAFPTIPKEPTRQDAANALLELAKVFADFPFRSGADASIPLAAILTLLARHAFPGPCPMVVIRAPTPGSGKSLLADAISMIATGRATARMAPPRDDTEARKLILTLGMEGAPVILVDNVSVSFGSEAIAGAITGDTYRDRLLGINKTATVLLKSLWILTGNNVSLKEDLARRAIICELDPKMEHPEDRTGFLHPDLLSWIATNRAQLVVAALTILRAYHIAGRPDHGRPRKGSFEGWDALIRGTLLWLSHIDPLQTAERLREEGDADLDPLRQAMAAWEAEFGSEPLTAAEAVDRAWDKARPGGEGRAGSSSTLAALAALAGCPESRLDSLRLGRGLGRVAGRRVDGRQFISEKDAHNKTKRWRLVSVDDNP
jgi:hypothetical protein